METKKRILEIDLAKGLAIILAVIGHAFPDAVKGFWIAGWNYIPYWPWLIIASVLGASCLS